MIRARPRLFALASLAVAGCLGPSLALPDPNARPVESAPAAPTAAVKPARALLVERSAELLDGPSADGQVGDFRLENDRVAAIVSAPSHAIGFAASGGNLVDAAPIGGHDTLKQLFGYFGDAFPRQPVYERIEARQRGQAALLIVHGHDADLPGLTVDTEYELAPGADAVAITSTVTNTTGKPLDKLALGDAIEWGRTEPFVPEEGLRASGRVSVEEGYVLGLGADTVYAYVVAEGPLDGRHGVAWSDFNDQVVDLPPGASAKFTRWLVIGTPSEPSLQETIASLRNERWAHLSGRILEEASGESLAGARVFLDDLDGRPIAVTRSTIHGYELALPAGEYRMRAEALGRRGPDRLDVSVGETAGTTHDLIMSKRGALAFTVRDGTLPLPAKLTVLGVPPTHDPELGPTFANPGGNVLYTGDGAGELPLPPGRYRVIASRGPEYTRDEQRVDVAGGETARAAFSLSRAIDGFGMRCADLHEHTQLSSDSAVTTSDRALSNLGEGLETMVASDHNEIAVEWKAALAQLHAARPLEVILGDEATVEGAAHLTAFPMTPQPSEPRGGAPDVRRKSVADILRALQAPNRVVVLEHPRAIRTGYFENIALDERLALPRDFAGGFDALEVFTGKDVSKVEPALRDWLELLDHGMTYTAVGGSDSHLVRGQEVGYPRTCVGGEGDKPGPLDAAELVDAIKRRRDALVTNGPFVRVSVAGHGMGQIAPAPRGRARLDVELEAAPWIDVRHLEVFVNGLRRGKPIEIPPSLRPLRWKGAVDLRIDRDSYVVVVVRGDAPLGPVVPADVGQSPPTPLAIANPIYLDRDGDGRFTPPSPLPRSSTTPAPHAPAPAPATPAPARAR